MQVAAPPVNLAMDVLVRDGGRETLIGGFSRAVGSCDAMDGVENQNVDAVLSSAKTVDVVLRSNAAAGASSMDVLEAWDGEIVIPNVPVER